MQLDPNLILLYRHCDGPATATSLSAVTSGSATVAPTTAAEEEEETESLPPSPTASLGCEPHGDHWHCDGPAATGSSSSLITVTSASATATVTSHTDEAGTESLAPSPTESVGCEPHGDHWHCDGPAGTSSSAATGTSTAAAEETSSVATGAAAGDFGLNRAALSGGVLVAIGIAL